MRRKVCYTFRRMVFHAINRLNALKEGFIDKSGKSLKVRSRGATFPDERSDRGRAFIPLFLIARKALEQHGESRSGSD